MDEILESQDSQGQLPDPANLDQGATTETSVTILENAGDSPFVTLDADQEKRLADVIESNWQEADGARAKWMADKQEGLNLYWGIVKKKDFPFKGCANLHVPLIRTISDTLHSNLMGSFDFDKPTAVAPVGPEDVPKARKAEKLLNWQFTTQVDYFDLVDKILQSCLIFGHAPVKVIYTVETENGVKRFDGIKVFVLQPERFLMPPDAIDSDVQAMDYVIQEIPMTKSDIKKRVNSGQYTEIDEDELSKLGYHQSRNERESDQAIEYTREVYTGVNPAQYQRSKKYVTVLEWHGSFDLNNTGIEEKLMVTFLKDSRKILRVVRPKGRRPFAVVRFSQILDKSVGESIPDLLKHINQELNVLHNQRVDSVTITNIPFFFFDPVAGFNPGDITLTPGVGIPTNGPPSQAVYFPSLNTSRPEMYREEDLLFQYGERMLGAGSVAQGIIDTKRVTAKEIQSVDRRAGIRFLTIFNRLKSGLKQIFSLALELDKDNMPATLQVRVVGLDSSEPIFDTMKKEDLIGNLDIAVNGNSIIDDQAQKQEMFQAYNLGMMNPLIMRDENAIYELTRDLFQSLGVKKVDSYLRKPQDTIPRNPDEEHNLFLQEEDVKPNIAENVEDHLKKHAELINSDKFALLSPKGQGLLLKHYKDTLRMDAILRQLALIQQLNAVNSQLMAPMGAPLGQQPAQPGQPGPSGGPQPPGMVPKPE